jgi:hypothetical protein
MQNGDSKGASHTPEERAKLKSELVSIEMADRWTPWDRKRMAELKALLAEATDASA